ncbi:MAG: lipopolysaccharide heptosyltransferase I [Gallionella sp.]
MKILLVRLSSLGDILHLFPAVSDLHGCYPDAEIHWLVEPAFAQMVGWHSVVDKVITVPLRSYKKQWWRLPRLLAEVRQQLKAEKYDLVLDAQGLLKSAVLSRLACADVYGFHADSARESLAARFYKKTVKVAQGLPVIEKNRQLVSQLFGAEAQTPADFGLGSFCQQQRKMGLPPHLASFVDRPCLLLLHGTTWDSKYWPESSWRELVSLLYQQGWRCLLPWGNEAEQQRAQRLADEGLAQVLPSLSLAELVAVLLHTQGFVSVETGIGHLATVLNMPGIMLHGPTDPNYSGILQLSCQHLISYLDCSPCFKRECPKRASPVDTPPCQVALTPQRVFEQCLSQFSTDKPSAQ